MIWQHKKWFAQTPVSIICIAVLKDTCGCSDSEAEI